MEPISKALLLFADNMEQVMSEVRQPCTHCFPVSDP